MTILEKGLALQALIYEARVSEQLRCAAAHADMPEAIQLLGHSEQHDKVVRSMMNAILDERAA